MIRANYTGGPPPDATGQAALSPLPTLEDTLRLWRERTAAKGPLTVTACLSPIVFATPLGVRSDAYVSHVTNSWSLINAGRLIRVRVYEGRDLYRPAVEAGAIRPNAEEGRAA